MDSSSTSAVTAAAHPPSASTLATADAARDAAASEEAVRSGRRRLPLGTSDVITYLHHAYPLSIAAAQGTQYENWLFNNYVQLRCHRDLVGAAAVTEFDFYLLPNHFTRLGSFLCMPQIYASLLWTSRDGIVPGIQRCVDEGWYIQVPLDEYYVPCRAAFGKRHYIHELLIFGYDRDAQTFDVLGFDDRMEFGSQTVSVQALEDAIALADTRHHYDPGGVRLYRYVASELYAADPSVASEFLHDYVGGRDTSQRFRALDTPRADFVYGVAVYEPLAAFYSALAARPDAMDIRPVQLLWEHKRCMLARLRRFVALGWLPVDDAAIAAYEPLVEHANALRLLGLKYWMTRKEGVLARMAAGLLELGEREKAVLAPLSTRLVRRSPPAAEAATSSP